MKLKTDRKKDLSMIFAALIVALVYIICVIYIYLMSQCIGDGQR